LKFEGEYPINGFGIQELRPQHVGWPANFSTLDVWMMSTAAGSYGSSVWTLWLSCNVDERCYLIITGIFNNTANPGISEVKPTANGQELPIIQIEQSYGLDVARVFFEKPFICKPYSHFKFHFYSRLEQVEYIGLMGYCIGKRAYLIAT
jgi:hypothetical protein